MFRRNKSKHYLLLFVSVVLLIFAMHFIAGMICRANSNPKVSDRFDTYLKPGVLLLLAPFLYGKWSGNILGIFIYFGAMFLYSVFLTLALFRIYEVLRKVIRWKHGDTLIFHRRQMKPSDQHHY